MTLRPFAVASVALVLAGSLALGACTTKPTEKTTAPGTAASPAPTTPTRTAPPLAPEPSFAGTPMGAAADVSFDCKLSEGTQNVEVTVKNSAAEARDYAIYIIWLPKDSGSPLGSGFAAVKGVQPGESKKATITAEVVGVADRCVKNVKAGKLAG